jgi:predicted TIM-barrel fold metal-dependent hydrolase
LTVTLSKGKHEYLCTIPGHAKLGMKGLRVYPQYHDYKITDPRFAKLLEKADALHMPVALSRWLVDNRQRSWMDINTEIRLDDVVAVVSHNPGTFVYLNGYNYPMRDQHLKAFRDARVYFDTVYATACLIGESGYDVLGLVKELGSERFLFGSAYPFRDPESALVRLEIVKEFAPPVREAIWSGNAQRLLRA